MKKFALLVFLVVMTTIVFGQENTAKPVTENQSV
jgi:hypothetical protein